jgi:DNA-binding transcriptional MerR regulator
MNGEAVMKKLGISKRTLQNYRDRGILPYSVVGGKFFYSIRDIEDLMANNYVPTGE